MPSEAMGYISSSLAFQLIKYRLVPASKGTEIQVFGLRRVNAGRHN